MTKYRQYFRADGWAEIEADDEYEAYDKFCRLNPEDINWQNIDLPELPEEA